MDVLSSDTEDSSSSLSILDTTLRDGEQTPEVSFRPEEKLEVVKSLFEAGIDRVEVCSAGASEDDSEALKGVMDWANEKNLEEKIEALTFVDRRSIDWLQEGGCKVSNLLVKGNLKQVEGQLEVTGEEHIQNVLEVLEYGDESGIENNVYLEDWSRGMRDSWKYLKKLVQKLGESGLVNRLMPCDTLGILSPGEVGDYLHKLGEFFPRERTDFHAHNDYGLATINSGKAAEAGTGGIHVTVNGLGERAGNAALSEVVLYLEDHLNISTPLNLKSLRKISKLVELYSGVEVHPQKPLVGRNAFTHTGGIHHDGEQKGKLYTDRLRPERFGRKNGFVPGKLSGKSTIEWLEERLDRELRSEETQKILEKVKWLGERKVNLELEDLKCLIDEFKSEKEVKLQGLEILKNEKTSKARAKLLHSGETYEGEAEAQGGFDAFMKILNEWADSKNIDLPKLRDYELEIPPGGGTDALVKCKIEWDDGEVFTTFGTSRDQDRAAVKASMRMINSLKGGNI